MVELWLTRHGQTVYNLENRVQGACDSPLTALGVADAKALGRGLQAEGITFDAAYSSDLGRARDSARYILAAAGQPTLPVITKTGLREQNFGKYEAGSNDTLLQDISGMGYQEALAHGITRQQIADEAFRLNEDQEPNVAETMTMAQHRFNAAMHQVLQAIEAAQAQRVLVVAHGAILYAWLDYIGYTAQTEVMRNMAVTKMRVEQGGYHVIDFDDRSYVEAGKQAQK